MGSAGGVYTENWVVLSVALRKVVVKNIQILKQITLVSLK